MAGNSQEAQFSIRLDDQVSDPAEDAAQSVDDLRDRILKSENAVKAMSQTLRRLKGTTDDVKKAKDQLKARINAEKDAASKAQVALLNNKEATGRLATAKKLLSGVVSSLKERFSGLVSGQKVSEAGMGALKFAAVGLAAALAAVALATAGGLVALGKFIIEGANAARSANLLREAASGSAANAVALGSQVDALARKLPTAKSELNDLAVSLAKSGIQGQTLVDTFNAVGQASAAMGDEAGNKLKALVDRGRLTQRFSLGSDLGSEDLRGTGVQRDDVAKALAERMKVGVDQARLALAEGRVKLGDGAAALKDAVEKKFGGLNLRKMMSLEVIGEKIKERLQALTSGVNLEPLLKAFSSLADLFDESSVSGAGLKTLVTVLGENLVGALVKGAPLAKQFFKGLVIGALQATIMFLQLRNSLIKTFGGNETLKGLFSLQNALKAGQILAGTLIVGLAVIAAGVGAVVAGLAALGGAIQVATDFGISFGETLRNIDWANLGASIVDGLLGGLKSAGSKLVNGAKDLAESVKGGFKDALGIHSPSKVFEGYGKNTVEGFNRGVEGAAPGGSSSLDSLGDAPKSGRGAGGPRSVTVTMPINIQVSGPNAAAQIMDPNFLAQLTKALEQVLAGAGVPLTA
jgi:hypothetical protein